MEPNIPMNQNPYPMTDEHIIEFVRKRNHGTKHFDLFPQDLADIREVGYGRVNMSGNTYMFDVIYEDGKEVLRVMFGNGGPDKILPIICWQPIEPGMAYSIYVEPKIIGAVSVAELTVPESLPTAAGWALGLVSRNRMQPRQVIDLFNDNQVKFGEAHASDPLLPARAYQPRFKKFAPWLAGTWCADRNGNDMNAKIMWGTSAYEPTYSEVIDMLVSVKNSCTTVSAQSRIDYVLNTLVKRMEGTEQ